MFALTISLFAAAAASAPATAAKTCDGASTIEVNRCLGDKLKTARDRLDYYVQEAWASYGTDGKADAAIQLGITASQDAFEAYRSIECDAVYEKWSEGSIRDTMKTTCEIDLTDQRTHIVWEHWLRYVDSTPPILPEPKPTE